MTISTKLKQVNLGLANKGVSLRIEQRGDRLNLRGPLPTRECKENLKVQRLSLQLRASDDGLQEAEKLLQLVVLQLNRNQFNWKDWEKKASPNQKDAKSSDLEEAINRFKSDFFSDPTRRTTISGRKTTWTAAYLPYLNRLLKTAQKEKLRLDSTLMEKVLISYSENSRSRQQCATAIGAFADYLKLSLPINWRAQSRGYGLDQARFRKLPCDELILEAWQAIPNSQWRLAYGLMATYGLRNHEIFFCDFSSLKKGGDRIIRVLPGTKTGEHQVWPFHPEWVDFFELELLGEGKKVLPKVNIDLKKTTLQQVGRRVSEQFRRYQMPLTPYDLRHAWAVRTIHIGLPDTIASRMMGHSVSIHTKTYHHWITRRDQQQAVDAALSKNTIKHEN